MLASQFSGSFCCGRKRDEIGVKNVFDEEFEGNVIISVAEKRNARASMAVALLLLARRAQRERVALLTDGNARSASSFG